MSENFNYSYSAERQAEVERIQKKYLPPEDQENKMAQLRKLDASVGIPGMIAALALGISSALVFGIGMCCFLVWGHWVPGCIFVLFGVIGMLFAPRLYYRMLKLRREKIAPEILRLAEELRQK